MKKFTKRILTCLIAAAAVFSLSVPALAANTAGAAGIGVEIGGKPVAFTDANPEIQSGRTFVPLRAIFESLGAQVTFDETSKTATAVRGNTTVKLAVGDKTITVTSGGQTKTIQMDVASYNQNNRIMVPARYVAEAFGCNVGWDKDTQTVLILDADSILNAGNAQYTLMDKYMALSDKYSQGCALTGTFNLSLQVTDSGAVIPVVTNGTISAVVDSKAVNMTLDAATDITGLSAALNKSGKLDMETTMMLSVLKDVKIDYILNIAEGKIYLRSAALSTLMGGVEGTWYSLDMNTLLAGAGTGFDYSALMSSASTAGFKDRLEKAFAVMPLSDKKTAAQTASILSAVASACSDSAFVQNGNTYTSSKNFSENGGTGSYTIALTMTNDAVSAFSLSIKYSDSTASADLSCTFDASGKLNMTMNMNMPDKLTLALTAAFQYAQATQPASTAPEAGSTVVPMNPLGK